MDGKVEWNGLQSSNKLNVHSNEEHKEISESQQYNILMAFLGLNNIYLSFAFYILQHNDIFIGFKLIFPLSRTEFEEFLDMHH